MAEDNKQTNTTSAKPVSWFDKLGGWVLLAPGEAASLPERTGPRTLAWIGIALAGLILLSVNIISSSLFKNATADLTEAQLYSISDGTKRVLDTIEEPIDVKVYFSERLGELSAQHKRYFDRVRGLFERYENMTGGKLNVSFIDPKPFSDAEDRAVAAGLSGVRLGTQGEKGYFGLVATNSTDDQEVVPFFTPERESFLEYDMTKLVHKLSNPKKPKVGIIAGLQINGGMTPQGQQSKPWQIMSQIEDFFDVEMLTMSQEEIPADIDVLMLVHPIAMTGKGAYAIDQFVLRGGRLLAFLDPISEIGQLTNPALGGGRENDELKKLLTAWGVKFDPTKVVGDDENARRVQAGGASGVVSDYVAWLGLTEKSLDQKEVVTDGVKLINLGTPGHFEAIKDAKTTFAPFIETSKRAMEIEAMKFAGHTPDIVGFLRDYKAGDKALVLAARVTGPITTAFPDGAPGKSDEKKPADTEKKDTTAKADEKEEVAAKSQVKSGTINAILVGDSDMLYDDFWVQVRQVFGQQLAMPNSHNAVFVMNALENLSGGQALSGLRGRGVDDRPFTVVNDLRREAEKKYRQNEQQLLTKLEGLQKQLAQVQQRSGQDGSVTLALTDKDKETIETARAEMIKTRQQLRSVQHALRSDIEQLEGWVKFINIALVPILIGAGGFAFAAMRRRQSAKHT
jgi:ABC-type uncharacterized transport system involved in gliding motility auxiliary subunit